MAVVVSPPPVRAAPIPRTGSSLSPSSSDSSAYPALGLAVQGRRHSPRSTAALCRRAASSSPLLAYAAAVTEPSEVEPVEPTESVEPEPGIPFVVKPEVNQENEHVGVDEEVMYLEDAPIYVVACCNEEKDKNYYSDDDSEDASDMDMDMEMES